MWEDNKGINCMHMMIVKHMYVKNGESIMPQWFEMRQVVCLYCVCTAPRLFKTSDK